MKKSNGLTSWGCRWVCGSTLGSYKAQARTGSAIFTGVFKEMLLAIFSSYPPELYYMRGPGPKWREEHAGVRAFSENLASAPIGSSHISLALSRSILPRGFRGEVRRNNVSSSRFGSSAELPTATTIQSFAVQRAISLAILGGTNPKASGTNPKAIRRRGISDFRRHAGHECDNHLSNRLICFGTVALSHFH
jgi:hypothetical protein